MKKKLAVWQLIKDSLAREIPVMLVYVLESKGSSPGRRGFFMCVTANGKMEGSIGGGIMEHKFVEMAREKLQVAGIELQAGQIKKQIHDKSAAKNQSGMICSGEQTVWIYRLQKGDRSTVDGIISCMNNNLNGTLALSPNGIDFFDSIADGQYCFRIKDETDWQYKEHLGYVNHLYIIGGGHCALALSKLMSTMDFYIHLFDDRNGLLTMQQNNFVHEKKIVSGYSELGEHISSGDDSYVVIMTFGYRTDDIAVRALIEKNFKYIGLLGSKKKIDKMFDDYRKEGIKEILLQKIHAPVGVPIKSKTPEEIAVSIAAEIIRVKNAGPPQTPSTEGLSTARKPA